MNKLVLICLLFIIPATLGATCNNPLLTYLDITKLGTSATQTGLSYCQGLEGEDLCCSAATINTLQTTINTLVADLLEQAVARDTFLLKVRTSTTDGIPSYSSKFTTFQTKAVDALAKVKTVIAAADEEESTTALSALQAVIEGENLPTITTVVADTLEEATNGLSTYQTTRATCINTLVEVQASIYCLACRTDYATIGVDGNEESASVDYPEEAMASISTDCYPYFIAAQKQNAVTQYNLLGAKLDALSTLMDSIKTDPTKVSAVELEEALEITNPTDDAQEIPTPLSAFSCSSAANCIGQINTFFLNDGAKIDEARVANGGVINLPSGPSGPVLVNPDARMLADSRMLSGTYDPTDEANSAGVAVAFPENVLDNSAWRQGGLMTCVVALVAMLLF